MSGTLNISACRRDSGSGAAHNHLSSWLCRSIDDLQANTRAYSNRGSMIRTIDDELFGKGDVLKVGGPEE
jgi:hypothetical protein